jgi:hypothetical protein
VADNFCCDFCGVRALECTKEHKKVTNSFYKDSAVNGNFIEYDFELKLKETEDGPYYKASRAAGWPWLVYYNHIFLSSE